VYIRIIGWGVKFLIEFPILAKIIMSGFVPLLHFLPSCDVEM